MAIFPGSAIPSAVSDYTIDQSLRLNAADAPYLIRTPGTGNRRTWSVSFWAKLTKADTGTYGAIWSAGATAAGLPGDVIVVETGDANWRFWIDNSAQGDRDIQAVARDPSAWYHVMCFFDSPNQTMGMYINGELQTAMRATGNPTLNYDSDTFDGSTPIRIGEPASTRSGDDCLDCYVAEFHMVDGLALAASDFGETDSDTNQWVPKKYTGSYGGEGFYLKFEDSADLGNDSSGNGNDFTANNLAATDQVKDSPTNNFCTLNPLEVVGSGHAYSFQEGNLQFTNINGNVCATFGFGNGGGKYYWEYYYVSNTGNLNQAITVQKDGISMQNTFAVGMNVLFSNGHTWTDGVEADGFDETIDPGDIVQVKLDLDGGTLQWGKNNTFITAITLPSSAGGWRVGGMQSSGSGATQVLVANYGQDSSFAGNLTAQGNQDDNSIGDFYYDVPAGFLAPCSSNLPDPSIKLPGDHFNTVLYTGDGTVSRAITGVGFTPDMAVAKSRSATGQFMTVDNVRGMGTSQMKRLVWNNTYASQDATTNEWTSLDSDGFTFSNTSGSGTSDLNTDTVTFATWSWKAGGTPTADNSESAGSTPTAGSVKIDGSNLGSALAGSIAATRLSANTTNGFSIITWAGNGTSNSTIAHGLTQAPDLFISKPTDNGTDYWAVYVRAIGQGYLNLNVDGAYSSGDDRWGTNAPTATVMNLGYAGSTNNGSLNYVGFCWHSIEGYSKVGVYEGNGDPDGAFIYTGFRPAMVMVKDIDSSGNWVLMDNKREGYNVDNDQLYPNETDMEATNDYIDIVSNGFKFRSSGAAVNAGETYMYFAISDYPFKYANAR